MVIDHAFIISGHQHALSYIGFQIGLGRLGVAVFFVLSGALITASFLNSRSWSDFVWRRFLRIYPAYLVCLLLTALVIGPAFVALADGFSSGTLRSYFSERPTPVRYVFSNLLLMQFQYGIGTLFEGHTEAFSVNGSLWTIPWEAGCYILVFMLGILGILKRWRFGVVTLVIVAYLNCCMFPPGSILGRYFMSERITLLPVYFLSGSVFFLYRDRIPLRHWMGITSTILFVILGIVHWPTAALVLPYCLFWVAHRDQPNTRSLPDFSYGIYIYGFPLQQAMFGLCGSSVTLTSFTLCSILLVIPFAGLSWYLIEKPSLRWKRSIGLKMTHA